MYGRDVFMESLLAHGVQHLFGNPGTTESPLIDSLARYPGIDYVLALHGGRRHRGRKLLRPGLRAGRRGEPARRTRPRQRHRHDLRRAPHQLAHGGDRRPAGHAASAARPHPGPRPGGHGGAGSEVERAGRERGRDCAHHAARLQDRARCAVGPGLRRAADQCDGAADRGRGPCRRAALPRAAAGCGGRRRHGTCWPRTSPRS